MSTIKVNSIKNTSTDDGGIAIDNSGHVQVDGVQLPTAGALSNRNLIINGAMNVAQRATSVTGVANSGYKAVDRMRTVLAGLGTYTISQASDGPSGFANSYKQDCTTADASPASSDFSVIYYNIEAQDLQHLNFGSSDALPLTLSFYVKSNKTGNASCGIVQTDNSSKHVNLQYTINAANTWEKKTLSIPGDTAGVINDDNGAGLRIEWWLNSGSNFTTGSHRSTWTAAAQADRNPSNLGIGGSTDDYWQITGIQLEVGEKATPFEHRPIGEELIRCQRYFHMVASSAYDVILNMALYTNTSAYGVYRFPVLMRATPSLYEQNVANGVRFLSSNTAQSNLNGNAFAVDGGSKRAIRMYIGSGLSGMTQGNAGWAQLNNQGAKIAFDAEF